MLAARATHGVREAQNEESPVNPDGLHTDDAFENDLSVSSENTFKSEATPQVRQSMFQRSRSAIRMVLGIKNHEKDGNDDSTVESQGDYYSNPDFHRDKPKFLQHYLSASLYCKWAVEKDERFNNFIIAAIVVAGINVGCQEYVELPAFTWIDNIVLAIFIIEICVKVCAEGLRPLRYFYGPEWKWNNFDFIIVLLSLEPVSVLVFGGSGGNSVSLLRLVRLARLGKLIKKIPQLQMIVQGLIGGLSSIGYILLLMFLVFYLYAVVGFYLFSANDPFHFGGLVSALLTLFRIATLANWGDVMYLNIFGCDSYANVYVADEDRTPENRRYWCEQPSEAGVVGIIYFVTFVVISALVMLSLFIGAVTMSMTESMDELKRSTDEKRRLQTFEKNRQRILGIMDTKSASRQGSRVNTPSSKARNGDGFKPAALIETKGVLDSDSGPRGQLDKSPGNSLGNMDVEMTSLISGPKPIPSSISTDGDDAVLYDLDSSEHGRTDGATVVPTVTVDETKAQKEGKYGLVSTSSSNSNTETVDESSKSPAISWTRRWFPCFYMTPEAKFQLEAKKSLEHARKMTDLLHFAMGDMAFEEREKEKEKRLAESAAHDLISEQGAFRKLATKRYEEFCDLNKWLADKPAFSSFVTFWIVVAAVCLGITTELDAARDADPGGSHDSYQTLETTLSVFETLILVIFWLESAVKIASYKYEHLAYFDDNWNRFDFIVNVGTSVPGGKIGFAPILRLLRLLRVLKLVKRLPQLAVIVNALIMGLSSIGYVGVILFLVFYVFAILGMILFKLNDPWHFGTLHISMITLFRAATLDDWAELMYLEELGCEQFPEVYEDFPAECDDPYPMGVWAYVYFSAFIVIAAQVLLTLFIGVISTSMDQAREQQKSELSQDTDIAKIQEQLHIDNEQVKAFKEVFAMLDLDKSGSVEEEELRIGLDCIEDEITSFEIQQILKKVDPKNEGVNVVGFIQFMCMTPRYKNNFAAHKALLLWKRGPPRKKDTWIQRKWSVYKYYFYSKSALFALRSEKAMIIQTCWRRKIERRKRLERLEDMIAAGNYDQVQMTDSMTNLVIEEISGNAGHLTVGEDGNLKLASSTKPSVTSQRSSSPRLDKMNKNNSNNESNSHDGGTTTGSGSNRGSGEFSSDGSSAQQQRTPVFNGVSKTGSGSSSAAGSGETTDNSTLSGNGRADKAPDQAVA
jgi:voltage-gated sodium channel